MKEKLSASRMNSLLTCPRKAYYEYEVGLIPEVDAAQLTFGKAWHAAMQARWKGKDVNAAFDDALAVGEINEEVVAVISGLLAGYYARWKDMDAIQEVITEKEFSHNIERSLTFEAYGVIDCIAKINDEYVLIEHKTTSEDINPDSRYWNRLKYNIQLYQYVLGAREIGYDITKVIYDVTRKPTIKRLASVPILDENGQKIVQDGNGCRVYKKAGKPKQTADKEKGEILLVRGETWEEYSDRLTKDTLERPDFYFARVEVPILINDLEAFCDQRVELAKQILHYRNRQKKVGVNAWPRNVQKWTCGIACPYESFCLRMGGDDINENNIPVGFKLKKQTV